MINYSFTENKKSNAKIYKKLLKLIISKITFVKLQMYWTKNKAFKMQYKNTNISRKYINKNWPIIIVLNKKENGKMHKKIQKYQNTLLINT